MLNGRPQLSQKCVFWGFGAHIRRVCCNKINNWGCNPELDLRHEIVKLLAMLIILKAVV